MFLRKIIRSASLKQCGISGRRLQSTNALDIEKLDKESADTQGSIIMFNFLSFLQFYRLVYTLIAIDLERNALYSIITKTKLSFFTNNS